MNDFSKRDLVAEISHQKVEEIGDCEVIEHTQLTSEGALLIKLTIKLLLSLVQRLAIINGH